MRSALLLHRHAARARLSASYLPKCRAPSTLTSTLSSDAFSAVPGKSLQFRFKSTAGTTTSTIATSTVTDSEEDKKKKSKPFLLDLGVPSLIPEWKKMFKSETIFTDVSAGLTVGCIAVPLSLAIALASGVPAEVGLVTAAVSGVAGGLMGGTTLAVTGPAAAISLLVVGAVQQHGLEALPFITLATGGLQMASGVTRVGVVAKLVPVSVIAGFTTGVGALILSGQVPKALGMVAPAGLNPLELAEFIGSNLSAINPSSAALAIGTSAAMFGLPKMHPKIPSALVAVGGATLATHVFGLDVALIGALPSGMEAFQFGMPVLPNVEALPSLAATTLLIYSMTSVESLLSCAALDKMKKTSYKHNPDQELVGQGLANMGSAFFMGMPVTSVIARSSLNVRLNASSRLPALVQSGFVFSSVAFMSASIAMIPMPALSGVLITTGIGMLNPVEFKHCYAVQKMDVLPFVATVGGMISLGLAEGIGIGCATALALELRNSNFSPKTARMQVHEQIAEHTSRPGLTPIHLMHHRAVDSDMGHDSPLAHHQGNWNQGLHETMSRMHLHDRAVHTANKLTHETNPAGSFEKQNIKGTIWQLKGPINFISMFEIDDMMQRIKENRDSSQDPIVLDMHGVTSLEFTGVEELANRLIEVADGTPIHMVNCSDAIHDALDQCDPTRQISSSSNSMSHKWKK